MTSPRVSFAGLALLAFAAPALAELPKVHPDFEIRLVAAVPAVQYPCQVATSPDGTLFIAENPMDQIGPAKDPIDRILGFREGKEPVVFADKLAAVFGMAWRDGALYVMHMPYLSVFRDKDGDGKADEREDLFTDLGVKPGAPNDMNDHIVSGIQFGMDGWLYIAVGDKGVPLAHGPDGREVQLVGGGVLRCRPDGTEIEVYSSGTRNHLEPNLDEADRIFTYDNTDDGDGWWTRVTYHIDGGYYGYPYDYHKYQYRMLPRIEEYGGGSPCGGVVYREDRWPEGFRGRVLWSEWGKREVAAFRFEKDGAGYKIGDVAKLVEAGPVGDFRPLDLALSPDGVTLYIADWGMGGWGNKTEKLGRVYAVSPKSPAAASPRIPLDSAPAKLIEGLASPSYGERIAIQAELVRRGRDVLPVVVSALHRPDVPARVGRHLVWVVDQIAGGTPEASVPLIEALRSPVAEVRAQAARALGLRRVPIAVDGLLPLAESGDPEVMLQALIALGRIGDPAKLGPLTAKLTDRDPLIAFAARQMLRRADAWPQALGAAAKADDPKLWVALFRAMELVYRPEVARELKSAAGREGLSLEARAEALRMLAEGHRKAKPWDGRWWGTRPTQGKPFPKVVDWEGTAIAREALESALSGGAPELASAAIEAIRATGNPDGLPLLRSRFATEPKEEARVQIAAALGDLKDGESSPLFVAAVADAKTPPAVREQALRSLAKLDASVGLAKLAPLVGRADLGLAARRELIALLGDGKVEEARGDILAILEEGDESLRAAAVAALGKIGPGPDRPNSLRKRIAEDPSLDVRKAAIGAVAALGDRDAFPQLLRAAEAEETRFEASMALAGLADPKALQVYLRGLGDKNPDLRAASSRALMAIRDQVAPTLQELAGRRELPASLIPELRKVYSVPRPLTSWHIAGPVPIDATPIDPAKLVDLGAKVPGREDRVVSWKEAKPANERGKVSLDRIYQPLDDVAAWGYTEVESAEGGEAELLVGSDDTLTVWLNGEKVYDFTERRAYAPDQGRAAVKLRPGKNAIVIKCGNRGGDWAYSVQVGMQADYPFLQDAPATIAYNPEAYAAFAIANPGDPKKGEALFHDLKGIACAKCHAVAGKGGQVGPDLSDLAAKYPREEVIASVLTPSAKISSGYETVVVLTADGVVINGVLKGETDEALELETAEAKRVSIPKGEIEERKAGTVSIMPNGLAEGLAPRDFADLIAYLGTLKTTTKPAEAKP